MEWRAVWEWPTAQEPTPKAWAGKETDVFTEAKETKMRGVGEAPSYKAKLCFRPNRLSS